MLHFLNIFYTILHLLIITFNLFGWYFTKTRKLHLIVIGSTIVAWLLIGMYVGNIGYCPLTDWHWDVKRQLGERQLPSSFVKYIIDKSFSVDSNRYWVDVITAGGLVFGSIMAIIKNDLLIIVMNFFRRSNSKG